MKKNLTLVFILVFCLGLYAQVGIQTSNPQGIFHVDAAGNNTTVGSVLSDLEQADDFAISTTGTVSIGTTAPSPYSALEIESSTRGLRLPQLSTDQITALDAISARSSDKNGLTVYNSNTNCINYWAETEWVSLCKCTPASGTISFFGPEPSPASVGNTSQFMITSGGSNVTSYVWKVNGEILQSGTDTSFNYTPTATGTYTISITGYGCRNSSITTSEDFEVTIL